MLVNPLFNQDDDEPKPVKKDDQYIFQNRKGRTIQPLSVGLEASKYTPVKAPVPSGVPGQQPAIELIRQKVAALYDDEPDVRQEIKQNTAPTPPLSKHQKFMHELSTSGKPLAQIQTEWHTYYSNLSENEKHEVWQEFYQANSRQPSAYTTFTAKQEGPDTAIATQTIQPTTPKPKKVLTKPPGAPRAVVSEHLPTPNYEAQRKHRTTSRGPKRALKRQLLDKVKVTAQTEERAKEHLRSLLFGLGTGSVVLVIFMFSFFNEVIIAPFIQPSRHVSATPIIMGGDSVAVSATPEVIIPKINVQIPVVYDEKSVDEAAVQTALERGIFHYPTTVLPGQQGNTAFFGHSSNNVFNKGKYKFAFVFLHTLVPGDTFHLTYNGQVFTYRMYDKKVVPPTEVSILDSIPGKTTAALITCDPPGTSTNRLVVWGEQISPDPAKAAPAAASVPSDEPTVPTELPSEGPRLWTRLWNAIF